MKTKLLTTQKINQYQEEIREKNYHNFQVFAFGGMIITGFILIVGIILFKRISFIKEYIFFFIYMILLYILARSCIKYKVKYITLIYYVSLFPIYVGGILMGTVLDPHRTALTIMILLCVLTLFIIDKPVNILAYMLCISTLFGILAYIFKDFSIFLSDMINLLIYLGIAIGVNYFSLRDRVENVENYVKFREKSERDVMTSLLNRGTGELQVKRLLEKQIKGAFIILDIDNFKAINDTYGHQIGDEVICQVTAKIQSVFRMVDIIWRLGGDEFAVFAVGLVDIRACGRKFSKLQQRLSNISTSNPKCSSISVSIGCTIYDNSNSDLDFEGLYRRSDKALYEAKKNNKGSYVIYINNP